MKHISAEEITEEQFRKYLALRDSGVINMFCADTGAEMIGESVEVYRAIMRNFTYLTDKFGK